jgi:thromboxane-A synthase
MSLTLIFLAVFLTLIAHVLRKRRCYFQLFQKLGIPGPKPNILWGNMKELRGGPLPLMDVMTKWEAHYGPVYGFFSGTRPSLVIKDLELVKEILVRNHTAFVDRPHMIVNMEPLLHTLVGLTGSRWKEVRAILSPTFSSKKMKQMIPLMIHSLDTTLDILENKAVSDSQITGDGCGIVDVYKLFQGLTCDTISSCALAMKVDSQTNENDR